MYDAKKKVEAYKEELEKRSKKRKSGVRRADVLQVRYETIRLDRRVAEAQMKLDNAYAALAIKIELLI